MARILVVEDDAAILALIETMLQMDGHQVVGVHDGATALEVVAGATEPFELVISDLLMSGMDGADLACRLRTDAGARQAPFLLLTAAPSNPRVTDLLRLSATTVLSKPMTHRQLSAAVARLLRDDRAGRAGSRGNRTGAQTPSSGEAGSTLLTTERLLLRPITQTDVTVLDALTADDRGTGFVAGSRPHINDARTQPTTARIYWTAIERTGPSIVGWFGLTEVQRLEMELGCGLFDRFVSSGYLAEGTDAVTRWAFSNLRLASVLIQVPVTEAGTCRVLEQLGWRADTDSETIGAGDGQRRTTVPYVCDASTFDLRRGPMETSN